MKKILFITLFIISQSSFSQYLSVEANTSAFNFIPAFIQNEPHFIFNASTGLRSRLSLNLQSNVRMESGVPSNLIFMTRYRVIDSKLKATLGIQLPALQLYKDNTFNHFFGQELILSYPVSKKVSAGLFILHGEARSFDFKVNMISPSLNVRFSKLSFKTQFYVLDIDGIYGLAETVSFTINKNFTLKGFNNINFSNGETITTLGLNYTIRAQNK